MNDKLKAAIDFFCVAATERLSQAMGLLDVADHYRVVLGELARLESELPMTGDGKQIVPGNDYYVASHGGIRREVLIKSVTLDVAYWFATDSAGVDYDVSDLYTTPGESPRELL